MSCHPIKHLIVLLTYCSFSIWEGGVDIVTSGVMGREWLALGATIKE